MVATRTKTAPARKAPKPATGRAGLTLRINGQNYKVVPIRDQDFGAIRAFRLTKPDGEFHDVSHQVYGHDCSCGDFVFRRDGIDESGCKHIKAAVAVGLLDARGGVR
jgi:hypothetical protein